MAEAKSNRRVVGAVVGGAAALAGAAGIVAARQRKPAGVLGLPRGRAVITGASAGIGEEFARQLAAAGFDLTLVARREERLAALAAELSAAYGIHAEARAADLSRDDDISALGNYLSGLPDLVLLVNNAGFGTRGTFSEVPLARTLDMIHVHVIASVALSRAALSGMESRGSGAIINVSSIAGFFPSSGGATYGATKAYLTAFSEALAAEMRDKGIKVQALCPGFTATEFHTVGEYEGYDRGQIPAPLWMPAGEVVAESLAELAGNRVIVVPGARYRAIVAAANGPFGGRVRGAARALRQRWRGGAH